MRAYGDDRRTPPFVPAARWDPSFRRGGGRCRRAVRHRPSPQANHHLADLHQAWLFIELLQSELDDLTAIAEGRHLGGRRSVFISTSSGDPAARRTHPHGFRSASELGVEVSVLP